MEIRARQIRQRGAKKPSTSRRRGRPGRETSPAKLAEARRLRAQGLSWRKVGAEVGMDPGYLSKLLKGS